MQTCQIVLGAAQRENQREENATLKASSSQSHVTGFSKSDTEEITRFAKKVMIHHYPWISKTAIGVPCPVPDPTKEYKLKYTDLEAMERHVTYVLYLELAPKWHKHLQNMPLFKELVRPIMN